MSKEQERRKMWQFPWGYRESIAFVMGVIIVGFMLQITVGNFNFYLLHYPINLIVGAALVALISALSFNKGPFVRWLSGTHLSVVLLAGVLMLSIIMGLIPQMVRVAEPHIHLGHSSWSEIVAYITTKLGFKQVTSSWSFVLIYCFTLLVLGLVIARRAKRLKWSDYGFYLNHLGVWLILFAAGLGAADLSRYVMYVEEGEIEWRVYDSSGEVFEPGIAIELHKFIMEEYAPKLAIADSHTGEAQPKGHPVYFQVDDKSSFTSLSKWDIELKEYIQDAIREPNNNYIATEIAGAAPAVYVVVTDRETREITEGWVTCGSYRQFMQPLEIDSTYSLLMTQPEPKRFASDISVIPEDKSIAPKRTIVEVNSPIRVGQWMIYQYDYDSTRGRASNMSGFELVYDPLLWAVYAGIALTMAGSIAMLWMGNKKRRRRS